jgi:hypothetical protein
MSFKRTIKSGKNQYRQLVESIWDKDKKQSRIHLIKHLRKTEKDGEEILILFVIPRSSAAVGTNRVSTSTEGTFINMSE